MKQLAGKLKIGLLIAHIGVGVFFIDDQDGNDDA